MRTVSQGYQVLTMARARPAISAGTFRDGMVNTSSTVAPACIEGIGNVVSDPGTRRRRRQIERIDRLCFASLLGPSLHETEAQDTRLAHKVHWGALKKRQSNSKPAATSRLLVARLSAKMYKQDRQGKRFGWFGVVLFWTMSSCITHAWRIFYCIRRDELTPTRRRSFLLNMYTIYEALGGWEAGRFRMFWQNYRGTFPHPLAVLSPFFIRRTLASIPNHLPTFAHP